MATKRTFGLDMKLVHEDDAVLPVTDLTVRRGYGAFDFLRVDDGVPRFVDDHLARLDRTCRLLGLTPVPSVERWRAHVSDLIDANGRGSYGVQMFVTAGDGVGGFTPTTPRTLSLVVDLPAMSDDAYRHGISLWPYDHRRPLPEAKTTNYFLGVYLAPQARAAGAADVLYHDGDEILETTRSNLFVHLPSEGWITPATGVLYGVTRGRMIDALRPVAPVHERRVTLSDLVAADEAFITSTTKGAVPVVRIGDVTIGSGAPGPATRQASHTFDDYVRTWQEGPGAAWRGVAVGVD